MVQVFKTEHLSLALNKRKKERGRSALLNTVLEDVRLAVLRSNQITYFFSLFSFIFKAVCSFLGSRGSSLSQGHKSQTHALSHAHLGTI